MRGVPAGAPVPVRPFAPRLRSAAAGGRCPGRGRCCQRSPSGSAPAAGRARASHGCAAVGKNPSYQWEPAKFVPCPCSSLLRVSAAGVRGGGEEEGLGVVRRQNCTIRQVLHHPAGTGGPGSRRTPGRALVYVKIRSLVKMSHGVGITRLRSQLCIFK